MPENNLAIRVEKLSKSYTIVHDDRRPTNLAEAVGRRLRRPLYRTPTETFWALRDVSFEVGRGEVVGIIGRNGAGKSTLLKVLSRITEPTGGRVELFGRVGSLLEVGTGFHPELTGRENIFLNGAILGMTHPEIRKQFDAIVGFAGVEPFLDTPVKRYSSGMYVRLAFAVAAHLEPEVLVVDEVLSVGDAQFQKKCLGKMREVAEGGRTVLFVSHHMAMIRKLCRRSLMLGDGRLIAQGETDDVVNKYFAGGENDPSSAPKLPVSNVRTGVTLENLRIDCRSSADSVDVDLRLTIHSRHLVSSLGIGVHLTTRDGLTLSKLLPGMTGLTLGACRGRVECRVRMSDLHRHLAAGEYRLGLSLHEKGCRTLLEAENVATLAVPEVDVYGIGRSALAHRHGSVILPLELIDESRRPATAGDSAVQGLASPCAIS